MTQRRGGGGGEPESVFVSGDEVFNIWRSIWPPVWFLRVISGLTPERSLLHLDVEHDPLVLFHVDAPDAVLPLVVGLGPIGRQNHAGGVGDLATAHSCKAQTHKVDENPWEDNILEHNQ